MAKDEDKEEEEEEHELRLLLDGLGEGDEDAGEPRVAEGARDHRLQARGAVEWRGEVDAVHALEGCEEAAHADVEGAVREAVKDVLL